MIAKALATGAIETNNDVFLSLVHQGTTKDALEVLKGQKDDTQVRQVDGLMARAVDYLAKDATPSELQSFYQSHWKNLSGETIGEINAALKKERKLFFDIDGNVHEDGLGDINITQEDVAMNQSGSA